MDCFMAGIEAGYFFVQNPFNGVYSNVAATPSAVHTIVFWSKDFSRFIAGGYGERLSEMGYNLFFNFTINSESPLLEPHIVSLSERLDQARALCRNFGPETVQWRFDPICFYHYRGRTYHNLDGFDEIARRLSGLGVRRCITSFADLYAKVKRRTAQSQDFAFVDPPLEKKQRIVEKMADRLESLGITLYTCCEEKLTETLGKDTNVCQGACIDNRLLMALFGGKLSCRKDSGQRAAQGCGCLTSRDIGAYDAQPCFHDCLYCYANPGKKPKDPARI